MNERHRTVNAKIDNAEIAGRFARIANQFCSMIDSAANMERTDLLLKIYRLLPKLIDEAISLPDVAPSDSDDPIEENSLPASRQHARRSTQEWGQPNNLLKENLREWDQYWQVFDPTEDNKALSGTLAAEHATSYGNLTKGPHFRKLHQLR